MASITQQGSAQAILKEKYPLLMYNMMTEFSQVLDLFSEQTGNLFEGPDGKGYKLSGLIGGLEGIGARLENEALPLDSVNQNINPLLYLKFNYARVTATYQARANLVGGDTAMATFNRAVIIPQMANLATDMDRQACGAGSGALARVDGTPAAAMPVDAPFGIAANTKAWTVLRRGMKVVFGPNIDGSGLRSGGQSSTVLSVDPLGNSGGGIANLDSFPADVLDDDFIFRGDELGANTATGGTEREMMGIEGLIDNGDQVAVLQNIDRDVVYEFNSQVIDATAAPYSNNFTAGLAMKMITDAQIIGNGRVKVLLCNNDVWRQGVGYLTTAYPGLGASQDRGGVSAVVGADKYTVALPSGRVEIRGVPRTAVGRLYGIDPSVLIKCRLGNGEWVSNPDGGMWHQVQSGSTIKDANYAIYRIPMNLGITDPRKCTKATGISETVT